MPMTHDSSPAFIARLKRRYLIGLCTIALLSVGTYLVLDSALHGMSDDANRLNLAGRQRVASFHLLQDAERLHAQVSARTPRPTKADPPSVPEPDSTNQPLLQSLATMQRGHASLLGRAKRSDGDALRTAYARIDQRFATLVEAAASLSAMPASSSALERLRQEQAEFQILMGEAADEKQRYAEEAIAQQRRLVVALLLITVITLLLEAHFVFEPAISSMRALLRRLIGNNDRMQWQACHDALTGLSNRRSLVERLEALRSDDRAPRFTLYFLDFDGFKSVNDTLGHEVGDRLLVSIAARLNEIAEHFSTPPSGEGDQGDVLGCYRLGGDEFVLLAIGPGAHLNSDGLAHSLVATFEAAHQLGEHRCQSTASVGVFESDGRGASVSRMLHHADLAMMRAKREGKGRHAFFDKRMQTDEHRRETIENDLFGALESGEIGVRYQPIVSIPTGRTTGVEALMHWAHPELGTIDNTELVDVSSRIEGIHRLGMAVLEQACTDACALDRQIDLYVNVHPIETRHPEHRTRVKACIERTGLPAARLHLECSGGLPTRGQAEYLTALRRLCSLGVQVGFDNVDREPMSLRALSDTPMSFVKLAPLPLPEVLDTFARLCTAVGLRTIATNVENAADHLQVRTARFEAAQGFHLGHPMDFASLQRRLLDEHHDSHAA